MSKLMVISLVVTFAGVFVAPMAYAVTMKPLVMGKRGVVAAGNPLVAEAGFRVLQQGGNAVDAGVASVLAAAVVEQMSFGMGGEAPVLVKLKGKPVVAINGDGIAPELATAEFYRQLPMDDPRRVDVGFNSDRRPGLIPSYGPLSAIVPGAVDALLLALRDYGTMSFAQVVQPAIELAQGFPVDTALASSIARHLRVIEKWPDSRRVYLPNGRAPQVGEIWAQPDLERTLQALAAAEKQSHGKDRAAAIDAVRDYFYRGPVAKRIGDFCKQAGCLLREGDFAAYHAKAESPVTTNFRGIDVYKAGFWSQGPVLIQTLNLLEGFDLKGMGQNSTQYVHTLVEAIKLSYADRDAYYGDPDFSRIPEALLGKEYGSLRRPLINAEKAIAEPVPGDPVAMKVRASEDFIRERYRDRNAEHQDTTCVNVIDKNGNMFSATPSGAWLPAVLAGDTGIPLSQRAQQFVLTPGHPNQIAPHKRPRLTLTPSLALRNGEPFLAFSTPGGDSQDQTLLQIFLNVVEFGMDPQEAIEAPRFNSLAMFSSFDDHSARPLTLELEKRFSETTLEALRAKGHTLVVQGDWENPTAPTMIEFDQKTSVIKAGADVRGHRYAIGW